MTIEPHDSQQNSFLSSGEDIELKGLINLLVLLLLSYNVRGVVQSLIKRNFVLKDLIKETLFSGVLQNPENYQSFAVCLTLVQFPIYAWILEKMAAKGVPSLLVRPMIFAYLFSLLAYPVILIQWIDSNVLSGTYLMLVSVGLFLKLTSFHHVMGDNRDLMKRLDEIKKSKEVI